MLLNAREKELRYDSAQTLEKALCDKPLDITLTNVELTVFCEVDGSSKGNHSISSGTIANV